MSSAATTTADRVLKPGSVVLGLRNIYIFPTSNGCIFVVAMFLLLLCAINYSSNLLHGMVFFFGGLFLVCLLHTYRSLWGLVLEPGPAPESTFVGSDLVFSLVVHNDRPEQRHGLAAKLYYSYQGDSEDGKRREAACKARSIPGAGSATINVTVAATRRGWIFASRITLDSVYPLGLFRAWTNWKVDERALVYPVARGNKPLPPASKELEAEPEHGARTIGRDEYEGLKPYFPGAPLRDIHWKKSTQDEVFVHDFSGYDSRIWMFDLKQTAGIEDYEEKISQLCMWIMILREKNQIYGLVLPDTRIEPGTGLQHDHKCFTALALTTTP